jgi:hypothetical protein
MLSSAWHRFQHKADQGGKLFRKAIVSQRIGTSQ